MMSTQADNDAVETDAGFTLLEMVIALALLALITALLAGSMSAARRVLAVAERNTAFVTIGAAQNYLRSALAEAVPPNSVGSIEALGPAIEGSAATMQFTTTFSPAGLLGGTYRIEVQLEPVANRRGLFDLTVRQTQARSPGGDGAQPTGTSTSAVLVPNVTGATMAYFGATGDDGAEVQWQSDWTEPKRLPRLVRIDVQFATGDPRSWQRMQAPLLLAEW